MGNLSKPLSGDILNSITYDVPNTLVKITLRRFSSTQVPPHAVAPFIRDALISVDQIAEREGGATAHFGANREHIEYSNKDVGIYLDDKTLDNPDVAGGRPRFDEARAVYRGIGDVIRQLGYGQCQLSAWRTVQGRTQKVKLKFLFSGYFVNVESVAGLVEAFDVSNQTARSFGVGGDGQISASLQQPATAPATGTATA
ncbi:MAG: hypothetical protein Q9168_006535 [Polycauliona sp. 1 TL-2023]